MRAAAPALALALSALLLVGWNGLPTTPVAVWQEGAPPRPRDLNQLAREYRGIGSVPPLVRVDEPDVQVGRIETFWVGEQGTPAHFQVQAELRLITRHAYWYVQQGSSVSSAALNRAADAFERVIYPNVRRLVGAEAFPGLDNDARITVMHGNVPGVAGYVSSSDTYPRAVAPYSNEREIIYINSRSVDVGSNSYLGVLAHEFTHVVHEAVRGAEATWIKEGTADTVAWKVLPDRQSSYPAFFSRPDLQFTSWREGPAGADYYESASLFIRYLMDRFGDEALQPFLSRPGSGSESIDAFIAALGEADGFAGVFRDWVAANVVGSGAAADFPLYLAGLNGSPRVERLREGGRSSETVAQFGADYYELAAGVGGFRFAGSPSVAALGSTPHRGGMVWHAGREDSSVATMTRLVDLTGIERAELSFWTWFDIETDYDFGYVAVSRDGGQNWTIIRAPGMSANNASGNNLGAGFTGKSGGGDPPAWTQVRIDLTPYAGGPLLVRLAYVTDDAVTRDGFAVDELQIVPLGEPDGAEQPPRDWATEGWTRLPAALPQRWLVQVLLFSGNRVERDVVSVNRDGEALWSDNGRRFDRAIAIISGATIGTLQPAGYTLEAR